MIPTLPSLPYELIGKATVLLLGVLASLVVFAALGLVVLAAWMLFWHAVIGWAWRGYSPAGEYPPLWRLRVSGVALKLKFLEFRRVPEAWRRAEEVADDETTLKQYVTDIVKRP